MFATPLLLTNLALALPNHPPVAVVQSTGEGNATGGGWLDGDHDGVDDIALASWDSSVLQVFTRGDTEPPVEVALPQVEGALRQVLIGRNPDGTTFAVLSSFAADDAFPLLHATWTSTGFVADWTAADGLEPQWAGDLDGDARTDLITLNPSSTVWFGASGLSAPLPETALGRDLSSVRPVGDVDGDGHDDLVLAFEEDGPEVMGYPARIGHAALYRGAPDGIEPTPLWTLESRDLALDADVLLGGAAVGLGGGNLVLSVTQMDARNCRGDDWLAVVHDADTAEPVVRQIVDVPIDGDCEPNRLVLDTAPNGLPAVVTYSDGGIHWFKWNPGVGKLPDNPGAAWFPHDDGWGIVGGSPAAVSDPLAFFVVSDGGVPLPGVAVWTALHVGTDPAPPEDPPTDDPAGTGDEPHVEPAAGIVVTPEGTTCWCAVNPVSGGAGVWLAALAVRRARRRSPSQACPPALGQSGS